MVLLCLVSLTIHETVVEVKLPEGVGNEQAEGEGKCWC